MVRFGVHSRYCRAASITGMRSGILRAIVCLARYNSSRLNPPEPLNGLPACQSEIRRMPMNPSGDGRSGCHDFQRPLRTDRRSFLKAGILGSAGLGLAELLRSEAQGAKTTSGGRQPSVIILWMRGGPSHIDMWDPKPDAPAEYRGEFKTIPTSVPGILTTELLPLSARMQDRFSIIRSLNHHDAGHST